ncbi:hypothetical protein CEXT_183351 [Caerostris extrusa]|uniref:Uncharacterized protein n=1 Tax=Caerostris extrusa TaxID=172846 RepID=A0AAV4MW91_CAEEX|nr:hypothetical protein CEXT_183351 [Caerostris extrusa]
MNYISLLAEQFVGAVQSVLLFSRFGGHYAPQRNVAAAQSQTVEFVLGKLWGNDTRRCSTLIIVLRSAPKKLHVAQTLMENIHRSPNSARKGN